jgi:YebC/PmpR family DNA-binding regulatory protein
MSGHSKWHSIKHKKGALDAKRGKIFTRLIKEIVMGARIGGGNPDNNARLRKAIADAKAESMPQDNIKRAIQRGTGELEGAQYEEITFEGFGPGGVAVIVETATDNRNRTVSEVRHCFGKNGGNMGTTGSVSRMFHKKGYIVVAKSAVDEEKLMNLVLENGGEDLSDDGDNWEILTDPANFEQVLESIRGAGVETIAAEISMIPDTYTELQGGEARQMMKLLEALEDNDDVQNVYSNLNMNEAALAEAE